MKTAEWHRGCSSNYVIVKLKKKKKYILTLYVWISEFGLGVYFTDNLKNLNKELY